MEDRPVMTDDAIIKDYPRLKLEYTRLHEDYRRLQSKQLITDDVSSSVCFIPDDVVCSFRILNLLDLEIKRRMYKFRRLFKTNDC